MGSGSARGGWPVWLAATIYSWLPYFSSMLGPGREREEWGADSCSNVVEFFPAWYVEHLRCKTDTAQLMVVEPEEFNHSTSLSIYTV